MALTDRGMALVAAANEAWQRKHAIMKTEQHPVRPINVLNETLSELIHDELRPLTFQECIKIGTEIIMEAHPHEISMGINSKQKNRGGFVGVLDQEDREDPHQRDIYPDGIALAFVVHLRVAHYIGFKQDEIDAVNTAIHILDREADWVSLTLLLKAMNQDDNHLFPFGKTVDELHEWALSERTELAMGDVAYHFTERICALIAEQEEKDEKEKIRLARENEIREAKRAAWDEGYKEGLCRGRQHALRALEVSYGRLHQTIKEHLPVQ